MVETLLGSIRVRRAGAGAPAVLWHSLFDSSTFDGVLPDLGPERELVNLSLAADVVVRFVSFRIDESLMARIDELLDPVSERDPAKSNHSRNAPRCAVCRQGSWASLGWMKSAALHPEDAFGA
jgi:hypothetical protein